MILGQRAKIKSASVASLRTRSKKEMFLGLIIVIAGIGTEPVFLTVAQGFGWFSLFIMLVGVYIAVLGYLDQRLASSFA